MAKITGSGRETVRCLLNRELGADVTLSHDPDGAPLLEGSSLHISISHSRHWAALALDPNHRIGVDIEEPRLQQLSRVAGKFLSEPERSIWQGRLLEAWTCKEAVYKAAGVRGLPLADIDLTSPGLARIPDGRTFTLSTEITSDYTLTTATPYLTNEPI